ncbi:hypothetical protein EVAR_66361_1 [Eumeta japonica]|uniref:Uncharacterized protein n=1 Tax=Eumeta variegata TaxID=151549 RepID=A0A4C1SUK6_EUMVA|nr:hypothetical protein EVAR_66361_1 [Eumeta japonica]
MFIRLTNEEKELRTVAKIPNYTKNCWRKLLTDELAEHLCWKGTAEKKSARSLTAARAIRNVHHLLESFVTHLQEHFKDVLTLNEINAKAAYESVHNGDEMESEGIGIDNVFVKVEEDQDPLFPIKNETKEEKNSDICEEINITNQHSENSINDLEEYEVDDSQMNFNLTMLIHKKQMKIMKRRSKRKKNVKDETKSNDSETEEDEVAEIMNYICGKHRDEFKRIQGYQATKSKVKKINKKPSKYVKKTDKIVKRNSDDQEEDKLWNSDEEYNASNTEDGETDDDEHSNRLTLQKKNDYLSHEIETHDENIEKSLIKVEPTTIMEVDHIKAEADAELNRLENEEKFPVNSSDGDEDFDTEEAEESGEGKEMKTKLTRAEIQKRYRAKLKLDAKRYEEYKQKARERSAKQSKRGEMPSQMLETVRAKALMRYYSRKAKMWNRENDCSTPTSSKSFCMENKLLADCSNSSENYDNLFDDHDGPSTSTENNVTGNTHFQNSTKQMPSEKHKIKLKITNFKNKLKTKVQLVEAT